MESDFYSTRLENKEFFLTPVELDPRAHKNLMEMGFSEEHVEKILDLMKDLDYDDCKGKARRFVRDGIVFDPSKRIVCVKKFHDISEGKGQCGSLSLLLLDRLAEDESISSYISDFNKKEKTEEYRFLEKQIEEIKSKLKAIDLDVRLLFKKESNYNPEEYKRRSLEFDSLQDESTALVGLLSQADNSSIHIKKCFGQSPTHFIKTENGGGGGHVWLEIECSKNNTSGKKDSTTVVLDPSFRKVTTKDGYTEINASYNPKNIVFKSNLFFKKETELERWDRSLSRYKDEPLETPAFTIGCSSDGAVAYNLTFGWVGDKCFPRILASDSIGQAEYFSNMEEDAKNFFAKGEITEEHIKEIKELLVILDPESYLSSPMTKEIIDGEDIKFNGFSK